MKRLCLICLFLGTIAVQAQQPVVKRLGDWIPPEVQLQSTMQGMALHGRYAVTVRHGGQCVILDLKRHCLAGAYLLDQNRTHCNNAAFATITPYGDSPFPLLYVSSCYGDKACMVTQLGWDSSVLIQKIFFDSERFPVAQDWCVDGHSGHIYAYGGKKGSTLYLLKFVLPSPTSAEAHLTEADILEVTPITCVRVAQGSKVKDGYAYLPDGDNPGSYFIHVVELGSGREVRTIDLNPLGLEPEGIDIQGRWIYVSFHTPDPKDNCIYRFRL